jgi:integrase
MTKQGNENTEGRKRTGRRTFGSVRRLPSGRWQARYPDRNGRMLAAPNTFLTKADAARYLALVEADITRNVFLDPSKGRMPFKEWATNWLQTLTDVRPTTRAQYDYLLGRLVMPRFADMPLADIDAVAVRAWMAALEARPTISPTTAAKAYRLLRRIMAAAVEADYIAKNPCTLKRAGVERSPEMQFATPKQVGRLATKMPERYRALVLVAAYGGLRWGELVNLRRRHVDLRRGTVDVVEQVTELAGRLTVGPPKSTAGRRTVTLPASVLPALAEHLERWAEPGPDGLVFPAPEGGFLRHSNFRRRVWLPATKAAGLQGLRFHDYADLLVMPTSAR